MGKHKYLLIPVLIVGAIIAFAFYPNDAPDLSPNKTVVLNFDDCQARGYPIQESYPAKCLTPDGQSFTQEIGNEMDKSDLIRSDNPRSNQVISSPLEIRGQARGSWFFEASFSAKLVDADNKVLAEVPITSEGEWMTNEFVPFKGTMNFDDSKSGVGTLILQKANASGLPENDDELRIPVQFSKSESQKTTVKIFYTNSKMGAECEKTLAVERQINVVPAIGRAAIDELLKGPNEAEKALGYITSINPGVRINNLVIENGKARIDFSKELDKDVGGSCRVGAIRAQITETLKQFPTVKDVIISVDGRIDDVLQP